MSQRESSAQKLNYSPPPQNVLLKTDTTDFDTLNYHQAIQWQNQSRQSSFNISVHCCALGKKLSRVIKRRIHKNKKIDLHQRDEGLEGTKRDDASVFATAIEIYVWCLG